MQINLNVMLMAEYKQAACESISKGWTDLIGRVTDGFPKEVMTELRSKRKGVWDSPGGPVVKNPPANAATRVRSPVWEDPIWHGASKLVRQNC